MPQAIIANNAATTLSTAITTTGQLSMVVVDASKFPVPSGGDYFYCTLLDASNIPEIVKVTAVAGTTFTIVRGQDGSTARTFTSGASVRLALTKAVLDEFSRVAYVDAMGATKATKAGDTYSGAHDFTGATVQVASPLAASAPTTKAYVDALAFGAVALPGQAGNAGKTIWTDGANASWQPEGGPVTVVSGTTQTAVAGNQYALTNASASTLTLPATPSAGDTVVVCIANSRTDNIIARNGLTIMGLAEDMTIDNANATVTLRYLNSSWRLV